MLWKQRHSAVELPKWNGLQSLGIEKLGAILV